MFFSGWSRYWCSFTIIIWRWLSLSLSLAYSWVSLHRLWLAGWCLNCDYLFINSFFIRPIKLCSLQWNTYGHGHGQRNVTFAECFIVEKKTSAHTFCSSFGRRAFSKWLVAVNDVQCHAFLLGVLPWHGMARIQCIKLARCIEWCGRSNQILNDGQEKR